jgi:hypothetical protein
MLKTINIFCFIEVASLGKLKLYAISKFQVFWVLSCLHNFYTCLKLHISAISKSSRYSYSTYIKIKQKPSSEIFTPPPLLQGDKSTDRAGWGGVGCGMWNSYGQQKQTGGKLAVNKPTAVTLHPLQCVSSYNSVR